MSSVASSGGCSRWEWEASADLVVVGTGVAGLTAALDAAELGLRVIVITKDVAGAGCTPLAQGGVAVVLGDIPGDSVEAHVGDTLAAGGGLNDSTAVASIIAAGPAAVTRLRARGAVFDPGSGAAGPARLARTREGGHRALRVIHAGGDGTGAELERALLAATADRRLPLLTGHVGMDALRDDAGAVVGLTVLDDDGRAGVLRAPAVLLATGGYRQVFGNTTTAATATPGMVLRSPCVPGRPPPTSSSSSSIQPRCTCRMRRAGARSSPRPSAVRGPCCATAPACRS